MRPALRTLTSGALALTFIAYSGVASEAAPATIEAPLGCVDTVIANIAEPTSDSTAGGGLMTFRDNIAPGRSAGKIIDSVYLAYGDSIVGSPGDRVRVCLLGFPKKQPPCDPTTSPMGREFLVYDESVPGVANAMISFNTAHLCGGA